MRTVIPMFPDLNELAKNPPTYDEAIRLPSPVTPTEPQRPSLNQRSGTPPPAFDEVNVQNTANQANTVNESSTITINSNLKCNTLVFSFFKLCTFISSSNTNVLEVMLILNKV